MNYFYEISRREKLILVAGGMGVVLLFAYFFYRSLGAILPLLPLFILYHRDAARRMVRKKQGELKLRFKEVMETLSVNLKAGYSVENAFLVIYEEMGQYYGAADPVEKLLAFIKNGIDNHIPLEKRIKEAGQKSGIREIVEFAGVFGVAKGSGGNMIATVERTALLIGEKIETEKEIEVLLSARKTEQKIMNIVPFFILFYLNVTSPGFFQVLYHNPGGIAIMSVCLMLYLTAFRISAKMLTVEV